MLGLTETVAYKQDHRAIPQDYMGMDDGLDAQMQFSSVPTDLAGLFDTVDVQIYLPYSDAEVPVAEFTHGDPAGNINYARSQADFTMGSGIATIGGNNGHQDADFTQA
jgi:hypothetical protein